MRPSRRKRLPNALIGLIMVLILAAASYMAFAKRLPWTHKFEIHAVFTSAGNIRPSSPVRVAGVNIGKVTSVEHLSPDEGSNLTAQAGSGATPEQAADPTGAAVVTMELDDESALPIHTDATMKIRPRLFLEGNLFVDVKTGSPSAPDIDDGYTIPATQTAIAVQLDQVLTTLQSDVRSNLQVLLEQFGNALTTYDGAAGLREFYRSSTGAFKNTSLVNEALLGKEPHDLSGLVKNLDSTVVALNRNPAALQDLVTNLRIVTGSFAAQDQALAQGIAELPKTLRAGRPALASLNDSFPQVRAFAREVLPGVRTTPATLDSATPLLGQVRGLVSKPELRGLVHDLRPTIPRLAELSHKTVPFLNQSRALSSCFNEVIIPWSQKTINDPETPAPGKIYEELGYGLEGLNGESGTFDGNGELIRVVAGGGVNTVTFPGADPQFGLTPLPLQGARPAINSSLKTPFRPEVPCEKQDPPNLESGAAGAPPAQSRARALSPNVSAADEAEGKDLVAQLNDLQENLSGKRVSAKEAKAGGKQQVEVMQQINNLIGKAYGMTATDDGGDSGQ